MVNAFFAMGCFVIIVAVRQQVDVPQVKTLNTGFELTV